jgi:hypothetical protein
LRPPLMSNVRGFGVYWLILYAVVKLAAYGLVAAYGLKRFAPHSEKNWARILLVVLARVAIGIALALPIFVASEWLQNHYGFSRFGEPLFYLTAYVAFYLPLRWVAWSLVAPLVNPQARSFHTLVVGSSIADVQWRGVGVLASCCVDLVLVGATGTIPIGKFFC